MNPDVLHKSLLLIYEQLTRAARNRCADVWSRLVPSCCCARIHSFREQRQPSRRNKKKIKTKHAFLRLQRARSDEHGPDVTIEEVSELLRNQGLLRCSLFVLPLLGVTAMRCDAIRSGLSPLGDSLRRDLASLSRYAFASLRRFFRCGVHSVSVS